jgi:hypothetical protein
VPRRSPTASARSSRTRRPAAHGNVASHIVSQLVAHIDLPALDKGAAWRIERAGSGGARVRLDDALSAEQVVAGVADVTALVR